MEHTNSTKTASKEPFCSNGAVHKSGTGAAIGKAVQGSRGGGQREGGGGYLQDLCNLSTHKVDANHFIIVVVDNHLHQSLALMPGQCVLQRPAFQTQL